MLDGNAGLRLAILLASLVAPFARNVAFNEPDVTFDFEGTRVGLAAKVLYTGDPRGHLARIAEGARQIETSSVAEGFVVVNLVEQFPHAAMFSNFVDSGIDGADAAEHVVNEWVNNFAEQYDLAAWGRRFRDKSKLLSLLFFLPTVLHIHGLQTPIVPYYRIHVISRPDREERAKAFEVALNNSCVCVLPHRPESQLTPG
jgi:hypothetical protein